MNKFLRLFFFIFVFAVVATSFLWCASFAFRVLMSIDPNAVFKSLSNFNLTDQVRSFPQDIIYYQQRYGSIYPKQLKLAWFASIALHGFVIYIIYKISSSSRKLYGDARFATYKEVSKSGLFVPANAENKEGLFAGTKIIVGRLGKKLLALGGQQFAYLAAPTRSGKGRGVVVPVGLSYSDSMVVLDIKNELFDLTGAFRAMNGHSVYLFDPYNPDGRTACWNPLSYIRRDSHLRVADIDQISLSLIPDKAGGKDGDNFFEQNARNLFLGLTLYCLDKEKHYEVNGDKFVPTVKEVLDLATDLNGNAVSHFSSLAQDEFLAPITKQTLTSVVSAGEETFASILTTLTGNLSPWLSETVVNATSHDDFDLRDVRRKKITIYLGIMPGDLTKAKKIINLFYSQLIDQNTYELPNKDNGLKYQCLLLMDEGTAPGRIAILEQAVSYMAGYNLRLLFIAQSPAQLQDNAVYGEHGCRKILTNIALKIMFKPNDYPIAEEYSKILGKTTVKEDTQLSRGGGNKGVSRTETQNARDLMMPQELMEMSTDKEIVLYEGISHPIFADKIRYDEDPAFNKRYTRYGKAKVKSIRERIGAGEADRPKTRKFISRQITSAREQGIIDRFEDLTAPVMGFVIGNCIQASVIDPTP